MAKKENGVTRITKRDIINMISKRTEMRTEDDISLIKLVYNTLDDIIYDALCEVTEDNEVKLKLFEGVSIDGKLVKGRDAKNNLTGEMIHIDDKITPKFTISRTYIEKLNGK